MKNTKSNTKRAPGDVLLEDIIKPLKLSIPKLAEALKVPANRIYAIINGKRDITHDTAFRLGKFFETGPEFWLALQQRYTYETHKHQLSKIETDLSTLSEWLNTQSEDDKTLQSENKVETLVASQ